LKKKTAKKFNKAKKRMIHTSEKRVRDGGVNGREKE
jgi:hypothetical protein